MPEPLAYPSTPTLKRYGMVLKDWMALLDEQGGVCGVCRLPPKNGRLCVDHHHVAKWKKMEPAVRKRFVRGLVCTFCNYYLLGRFMTADRADAVAVYLRTHDRRKELFK